MPGNQAIDPIGAYGPVRSFLTLGTSVYGSEAVGAQMGPDCPCLSWEATNIWMASGTLEVYPLSRVVAIGMGTYNSLGEGKPSLHVGLQGPKPVGCVGLKTEVEKR